jgi:tetratricopeptide (TPR) repeat protein
MILIDKYCWRCKKPLDFEEFNEVNLNLPEEKVLELWNNPLLQFFCCDCYITLIRRDVKRILSNQEEYKSALKSNFNPSVWRRLAIISYDKGDYKKAEEAYKRVLEIDPSDLISFKHLRYVHRKLGKKK